MRPKATAGRRDFAAFCMLNLHTFLFYRLACFIRPLLSLAPKMVVTGDQRVTVLLVDARNAAEQFSTDTELEKFMPSSFRRAKEIFERLSDGFILEHLIDATKLSALQTAVREFETILEDELAKAPVFLLEVKGNLSIDKLLDGATKGYPPHVIKHLENPCLYEIDEAGFCLAFECPTASGFHILRAVEMTVKQYLKAIPGFVMPSLNRQTWGEYIKLLKDNRASSAVADTLQAIKDNHRNPLMHPEDVLDLWQAASLFSLCQTMIEALIADMKKRGFIS